MKNKFTDILINKGYDLFNNLVNHAGDIIKDEIDQRFENPITGLPLEKIDPNICQWCGSNIGLESKTCSQCGAPHIITIKKEKRKDDFPESGIDNYSSCKNRWGNNINSGSFDDEDLIKRILNDPESISKDFASGLIDRRLVSFLAWSAPPNSDREKILNNILKT